MMTACVFKHWSNGLLLHSQTCC